MGPKMPPKHKHPLQRLASPSPTSSLALHALGLLFFASSFHTLAVWDTPISAQFGWHFQFLTVIGLAISTLSFALGLLADLALAPGALFAAKNALAVCAAPLEVLISLLYWGIRAVDPALLAPPGMVMLPLSVDVGLHLVPAVVLVLDLALLSPPWTIRAGSALGLSLALATAYWVWVELCFSKNGTFPYPLMGIMTTPQRALLFASSSLLFSASTVMLKWLHGCINGVERLEAGAGKALKKIQ